MFSFRFSIFSLSYFESRILVPKLSLRVDVLRLYLLSVGVLTVVIPLLPLKLVKFLILLDELERLFFGLGKKCLTFVVRVCG